MILTSNKTLLVIVQLKKIFISDWKKTTTDQSYRKYLIGRDDDVSDKENLSNDDNDLSSDEQEKEVLQELVLVNTIL